MVRKSIKEIDVKKLKKAKGVMAVLELLDISEDDLLLLKEIPAIKQELEELRDFKAKATRTLEGKAENSGKKSVGEVVKSVYKGEQKEFNPHYGG